MKKAYFGISLGTEKTLVYSSIENKIVFDEPTCVAYDLVQNRIQDIGFLAEKLKGKTPFNYAVKSPLKNGYVDDGDVLFDYLNAIFNKLGVLKKNRSYSLIFTCPSDSGKVNRDALFSIGKRLYAKEVFLEPNAKISAYGIGDKVFSPKATLTCDIGSGITDIALLSMGEVISCETTSIAGKAFDEAIRRYMIQKQHLNIGLKTAQYAKLRIGSIADENDNKLVEIKGRDTITSLPSSVVISSGEIRLVLKPLVEFITLKITDVLSTIPPELAADVTTSGLLLTGGSALLTGLKEYLQSALSFPIKVVKDDRANIRDGFETYVSHLEKNEGDRK